VTGLLENQFNVKIIWIKIIKAWDRTILETRRLKGKTILGKTIKKQSVAAKTTRKDEMIIANTISVIREIRG